MKILHLTLSHFKGIGSFTLDTKGGSVAIYGDNGVGKTTIADAFFWLLFDKDSQGRKDFEIKTLGPDGEAVHGLDHGVEATLELPDGSSVTLRKVYKEKWTKRRGSASAEFTGHTTDYYVDGVPASKAEYTQAVAGVADEHIFRVLTDTTYFNEQLHWQKRRELLLSVCGDVSDADVIASDKELAELPAVLGKRTLEQHRKVITARRAEINRRVDDIPVEINAITETMPGTGGKDRATLAAEINGLRAQRNALEQERVRIQSGGEIAEQRKRIAEIEAKMMAVERKMRAGVDEKVAEIRAKRDKLSAQFEVMNREAMLKRAQIEEIGHKVSRLEKRMDELRTMWHEADAQRFAETFEHTGEDTCPACEQPLPADQVQAAHDKALAEYEARKAGYNEAKSIKLQTITDEGKRLAEERTQLLSLSERLQGEHTRLEQLRAETHAAVASLQAEIDKLQAVASPDPCSDPSYQDLVWEKDEAQEAVQKLEAGSTEALQKVVAGIAAVDEGIGALQMDVARHEQRTKSEAKIEELNVEHRKLSAELEQIERQLYLSERFIRAKVSLLEDRINSRFGLARFKLFNVLVNGGVEECCEVTYQGVPYGSLNHGSRLNVGIDVINTMSDHFGIAPPVFVDNAESVTMILPARGQMVKLVVSAQDKQLRVEVEEAREIVKEAVSK